MFKKAKKLILFSCISLVPMQISSQSEPGTLENPIPDSKMSMEEAFNGLGAACPKNIKERQKLISVKYYSFDGKIHQGQLIIDKDLVNDITLAFEQALKEKFPVYSVIPVSHPAFRKNGRWDDGLSMSANNSSSFNYRPVTGKSKLSLHAPGRAIDLNPMQNPYINGKNKLPKNSSYNTAAPGTLTKNSAFVRTLLARGWSWGGDWTALKDYQHLEKNK
jgi:hypothetical protein